MLFSRPPASKKPRCGHRLAVAGALAWVVVLAGCSGTNVRNPDTAASPGVTVYGTVDAGVGRTNR